MENTDGVFQLMAKNLRIRAKRFRNSSRLTVGLILLLLLIGIYAFALAEVFVDLSITVPDILQPTK